MIYIRHDILAFLRTGITVVIPLWGDCQIAKPAEILSACVFVIQLSIEQAQIDLKHKSPD